MNSKLSEAGRKILRELLPNCTIDQQRIFKLLYGTNKGQRSTEDALNLSIDECINEMGDKNIDHAITQCENSIRKNEKNNRK